MDRPVEYEFTLPDGSKRYEIIYERKEVSAFQKMHGAIKAQPVKKEVSCSPTSNAGI